MTTPIVKYKIFLFSRVHDFQSEEFFILNMKDDEAHFENGTTRKRILEWLFHVLKERKAKQIVHPKAFLDLKGKHGGYLNNT